jgi:hypothetical protein
VAVTAGAPPPDTVTELTSGFAPQFHVRSKQPALIATFTVTVIVG